MAQEIRRSSTSHRPVIQKMLRRRVLMSIVLLVLLIVTSLLEARSTPIAIAGAPHQASSSVTITRLVAQGGRVAWSPTEDLIAFDAPGSGSAREIYTIKPDGTGQTCLTCAKPGAPTGSKGNPAWHPSGKYIVFQAVKENFRGNQAAASPGAGKANDLWLMTSDGHNYHRLTNIPVDMWLLHPHFSPDGSRLLWSEMVAGRSGPTGQWALKIATFNDKQGAPALADTRRYQPLGAVFYESHGWSPDGKRIIFSAHLLPNWRQNAWMDIYTFEPASSKTTRLTHSRGVWDEHAQFSPDGNRIAWISSAGCACNPRRATERTTDLWLMSADGSAPARVTHFSDPARAEYAGAHSRAADSSWSPDGKRLAIFVIEGYGYESLLGAKDFTGQIYVLEFPEGHYPVVPLEK
jgi:Tol biopolymer transport system component